METIKDSCSSDKSLSSLFTKKTFYGSNLVISFGILLVTVGGGWDISNHLLNKPESFFSPPHALMYTGVAIALIGTVLAFFCWNRLSSETKSVFTFPVKLSLIGIFILVSAGPFDFFWHSSFGLDGLLSPPHITLISGMFLCSIGSMISIFRLGYKYRKEFYTIHHFLVVLAILPVWMVSSGLIYSFSLPFSQTDYFDFNPEVYFAAILATIFLPLIISTILIMSSLASAHKFGILSIVGILLLVINSTSSIIPNPSLIDTLPFYFLTIIPFVASDALLSISQKRWISCSVGAILGSTFFFFYFPLITHVYNEVIFDRIVSASVTANVYFEMTSITFSIVIVPAILMGIFGFFMSKKILDRILCQN